MTRSVAELVGPEKLDALARPSNIRLGRAIAAAGEVEFLVFERQLVRARVGGGQRRTSELRVESRRLAFSCTCSKKLTRFCKHLVATAIATSERASHR